MVGGLVVGESAVARSTRSQSEHGKECKKDMESCEWRRHTFCLLSPGGIARGGIAPWGILLCEIGVYYWDFFFFPIFFWTGNLREKRNGTGYNNNRIVGCMSQSRGHQTLILQLHFKKE